MWNRRFPFTAENKCVERPDKYHHNFIHHKAKYVVVPTS